MLKSIPSICFCYFGLGGSNAAGFDVFYEQSPPIIIALYLYFNLKIEYLVQIINQI